MGRPSKLTDERFEQISRRLVSGERASALAKEFKVRIGDAVIDELDVMKAVKAETAWRKIIARMRHSVDGLKNGVDVTTTPEGF